MNEMGTLVKATYQSQSLYGTGEVEIVATKK